MKKIVSWRRSLAGLIVVVCALCASGSKLVAAQVLAGHVPRAVLTSATAGNLPADTNLDLVIGLPLRNKQALTQLLDQIYNPSSSRYRHYLAPDQFTAFFGPTEKDYRAVIEFAKTHHLSVKTTHSNRTLLGVSGTVADIENAFHVNLRLYQHPTEARTFYAPDSEPSADLDVPLLAISGLDNYTKPHPNLMQRSEPSSGAAKGSKNSAAARGVETKGTFYAGSAPEGNYLAGDIRAAYIAGVSLQGTGQSVGLFELDGYYVNDITDYELLAKLPSVTVSNVLVDGVTGVPSTNAYQVAEVSLDIDMAISMAPGLASVIAYEGSSPNNILNTMATSDAAQQLSCSWSFPINASTEQIFQEFAAQGQSFFEASGDFGAEIGGAEPPSDNPYLTSVGGTTLSTASPLGRWIGERTWNWQSTGQGSGESSGGISTVFATPIWQQGVDMSANGGSTTMRTFPDVSLIGDEIWLIYNNGQRGSFSGTSVAAPLWAGLTALVNEQNATLGQPPLGFANPALYAVAKSTNYSHCFHDITTGNNTNASSPSQYYAVPGYDLCTGWGTPIGTNLIKALVQMPQDSVLVYNGGFESGSFAYWTLIGQTSIGQDLANGVISTRSFSGAYIHSGSYAAFLGESNDLATLSQIIGTLPGQPYLLSFWLTNPKGDTPNEFNVSWNGTTLFDQVGIGVLAWTNFQFVVTATNTNTALVFGARNDNDGFGLDDVAIEAIPAPSFGAIANTNGSLAFTWNVQPGLAYQLQYSTSLSPGNWTNSGPAVTATNATMSISVPAPSDAQGFYRLLLVP